MDDESTPSRTRLVAWVTGGASGIGAAVARRLEQDGASVAVIDVKPPPRDNERAWQRVDLTDRPAVERALDDLADKTGWPLILVLAAGVTAISPISNHALDVWDEVHAVNLTGALLVLRRTLPHMLEARYGRIVGFASGTAVRPGNGSAAYATSKAGMIALMKVAALEGALSGVTANTVAPGITDTPMTRALFGEGEAFEQMATNSPIANPQRTVLQPDDIADAVAFLCSRSSSRITGQVLHVNGGSLMP